MLNDELLPRGNKRSNIICRLSTERSGELFILAGAGIWGFFPVLTKLSLNSLPPIFSLAAATLLSCLFFGATVLITGQTKYLLVKAAYLPILLATFINGVGYYLFVFSGISLTSAGNAGIILQMEVFFSFVILTIIGQEQFNWEHSIGAAFMISGAVLVLVPELLIADNWQVIKGDLLITAACVIAPFGNIFTRKARQLVPSSVILLVRSSIASIVLLVIALNLHGVPTGQSFSNSALVLVLNGVFVLGLSKILWVEAIHRISIPKAISLTSLSPAITLTIAFFVLGETPKWYQILAIVPIMIGIFMLTRPTDIS